MLIREQGYWRRQQPAVALTSLSPLTAAGRTKAPAAQCASCTAGASPVRTPTIGLAADSPSLGQRAEDHDPSQALKLLAQHGVGRIGHVIQ